MTAVADSNVVPLASPETADDWPALRRFVAWACRLLGGVVEMTSDGVIVSFPLTTDRHPAAPQPPRPEGWGDERRHLRFDGQTGDHTGDFDTIAPRSPLVEWLIGRLRERGAAANSAPLTQPNSAGQIAERLLPAYRVESGRIHLAGCSLEDRAFYRIYVRSPVDSPVERFYEWTIDADGRRVDDDVARSLGLNDVGPLLAAPPALTRDTLANLGHLAEQTACVALGAIEPLAATLLWCKWAEGKLRVDFPSAMTEIRFADWAATLKPPPFVCPLTGRSSFALALTDDGQIAAAEEVATCAETKRRVLRGALHECAVTRQLVVTELTEPCPIIGRPVLSRVMATCEMCGEKVSPTTIRDGRCAACRSLTVATASDPRVARVLDEFPALDRWRRWLIAETATSYILVGSGWVKRLLVVLDRERLEPRRVAMGDRLRREWTPVPPEQWSLELGRGDGI